MRKDEICVTAGAREKNAFANEHSFPKLFYD
jgi:hypothetical protein